MDSIYLMGSEDVRLAASEMTRAADTMRRAAGDIDEILTRFMEQFRETIQALNSPENIR